MSEEQYTLRACDRCGKGVRPKNLIDEGYRLHDGNEVAFWVCKECHDEIYDEAMYYMPDY